MSNSKKKPYQGQDPYNELQIVKAKLTISYSVIAVLQHKLTLLRLEMERVINKE